MSLSPGRRGLWGWGCSLRGREPLTVTNGRSPEIAVRPPFARMNVSIAAAPVRLFPKTCPWTIYTRVGHRQSSESLVVGVLDGLRRGVHALVGGPAMPAAASAAGGAEERVMDDDDLLGSEEASRSRHRRGGAQSPRSYAASSRKARP